MSITDESSYDIKKVDPETTTLTTFVASTLNDDENEKDENNTESSLKMEKTAELVTPRLCHLKKWPHFQGYGFNLHAERAKTGQHIGKVDQDSPAESAGLKEGDRIIEVNNVNISNENHQQVVKRIRNGLERDGQFYEDEVLLLVLDNDAELYYREMNVIVKSDFKNVIKISTEKGDDGTTNTTSTTSIQDDQSNEEEEEDAVKAFSNAIESDNEQVKNEIRPDFHLSDSTNKMVANSVSSISQKSVNSNKDSIENNDNNKNNILPSTSSDSIQNNENLNNSSAYSFKNIPKNTENNLKNTAASSKSNLSVSSSNQSISSKSNTPNIQSKNVENVYSENSKENDNIDNLTSPDKNILYEQNSIDRRNVKNKSKTNDNVKNKVDPFQMSAAEFKTYLKSKGRADPRIAQVDMRQKFQMFQDM